MYALADIREALGHPYQIGRELNVLYHRRLRTRDRNPDGVDFVAQDWDHMVILDACRWDVFSEYNTLPGEARPIQSLASSSDEWVRTNVAGKQLYDTVILTANSWYFRHDVDAHAVIDWHDENDGWLTPDRFTDWVLPYLDRYPDKRFIFHYMTPHSPYLGPTGWRFLDRETVQSERDIRYVIEKDDYDATVEHLRSAYAENVQLAIEEVHRLLPHLPGKTVVTADHGEMLGERHALYPMRDYQHWHGIYRRELTEVPWVVIESGDRKAIRAEAPAEDAPDSDRPNEVIEERLADLGYVVK